MRSYPTTFIAATLLLAAALPAWAALGGAVSSVEADRIALRGAPAAGAQAAAKAGAARDGSSAQPSALYSVQAFALPNGTEVREFVAAGQVFGVAWQGASQPNLRQVFGDQMYEVYLQSLKAQGTPGSRTFVLRQSALVVHSFGLPGNFSGQAYLPQQLPAGVSAAVIK
ncbi:DUF2844 domain-containing protein [Collimonas pratensis]|uniref:DUF2844 domain-containing protein n=1 Tax=Collimonas pratensis TaxID=279113 RepID=UPI00143CF4C6|nr:DUF2844 domain-containing protein [Collimonas pratensis]NKI68790.1 DUF2844 domain-containing protein [Collimonas pratensis]